MSRSCPIVGQLQTSIWDALCNVLSGKERHLKCFYLSQGVVFALLCQLLTETLGMSLEKPLIIVIMN